MHFYAVFNEIMCASFLRKTLNAKKDSSNAETETMSMHAPTQENNGNLQGK